MKKILIVSLNGENNIGGVERVTQYLHNILSSKFDVKIIARNAKIKFGKYDDLFQSIFISFKLFLSRNKFVIANSWHCCLYPANISIHHGTMKGVQVHTGSFSRKSKAIACMEALSARFSKRILAVSVNCKDELVKYYNISENKIDVLNNFVDESIFFPKKNNYILGYTVLFVGSLCYRKGFPVIKAFAQYLEKKQNIILRIATNDIEESKSFNELKNTQVVTGLTLKDMPSFYNSGNILFYPSLYEGFSMATLEALACGIPVIGSSFAIPEELRDYGFCMQIQNDMMYNFDDIYQKIIDMIIIYRNREDVIHNEIINRFGKKIYIEKLLKYVSC